MVGIVALLWSGCSCQPGLPPDPPPEETTPPPDTARPNTEESLPPLPCDVPAVEPNNAQGEANALPLEKFGCGDFEMPGDLEFWSVDLPEDNWLGLRVDAKALGSNADVHVFVTHSDGDNTDREDDPDSTDVTMLFPAAAGSYFVQITEANFQGGDRYHYEVLATIAKPPLDWTRQGVEPNDDPGTAEEMVSGDSVFAFLESNIDSDWYRIAIPPGRHTLIVDVEAYDLGSAADVSAFLYNADLEPLPEACNPCEIFGDSAGRSRDPYTEYGSLGDEVIYVRIAEARGRSGDPAWYVLQMDLEGP